jgi:ribose 5-phosphate isomerase B
MKRFAIITEAEARRLDIGSSVELEPGGHVTPLAQDTLRDRRVTVVRADGRDLGAEAPTPEITRVSIASDHTGVALRRALVVHLRGRGLAVEEGGATGSDAVDYPDVAAAVARSVARGEAQAGIVIDGAGLGSAIVANKVAGIRAAMATSAEIARYSREHAGANVLTLGATLGGEAEARTIVATWLTTPMREPRYIRRLSKIRDLERAERGEP